MPEHKLKKYLLNKLKKVFTKRVSLTLLSLLAQLLLTVHFQTSCSGLILLVSAISLLAVAWKWSELNVTIRQGQIKLAISDNLDAKWTLSGKSCLKFSRVK